jgi:predicted HNH restriction endonuclease
MRATLLPEEKLEALLIHGNDRIVYDFIKTIPATISDKRIEYLYSTAPKRNLQLIKELQNIYKGRCQICKWNPINKYGQSICEAHHMHWLSRGGEDKMENLVLICPNHHNAIHKVDAHFDFKELSFKFINHSERILLNNHLFF